MKIAIHNSQNGLHPKWVEYCKNRKLPYKLVNCYSNSIIEELKDCDALLWHFHHNSPKDILFAKQLMFAVEQVGKVAFPNFNSSWHFDDKLGQKYLFELFGFKLVPTYAFYSKQDALKWTDDTEFPKVWKLRGGAGASNVKLIKSKKEARKYIKKAFGSGFTQYNGFNLLKDRFVKYKKNQTDFKDLLKGIIRLFFPPYYSKVMGRDLGYIYFQDFVPRLNFDYRVKVVGGKSWGYKRPVRNNDFRASGSGSEYYKYGQNNVPIKIIKLSQKIAKMLDMRSVAFDFVINDNQDVLLIESSCFFGDNKIEYMGYWNENLEWIEGFFKPEEWMLDEVVEKIRNKKAENLT